MTDSHVLAHVIDGRRLGHPEVERHNPARPEELVATTPVADGDTVADAVESAVRAQADWARTPLPARGAVLSRAAELITDRADALARDLTREEGKTLREARGEVSRAADVMRFFGGEGWRMGGTTFPSATPDTMVYTRKEPLGVVALITPWNFPIAIPAWKAAPALIAGNAVVLKPAGLTPLSAWHLVEALHDAGLPPGLLNLVYGAGSAVGNALVTHPQVAGISFTGSTAVGQSIYAQAAPRRARVQLEMGGKNALVVLDDADPARAAEIAAAGGFALTGQACTATSRVICTPGIHDAFVDALVAQAARYHGADGLDAASAMGPVVSRDQWESNRRYLDVARHDGGRILTSNRGDEGLFQDAVVIAEVEPNHRVAQEEIFGPIVSVLRATDLKSAVDILNDVPYGLSAGIVTNDLSSAHYFAETAHAGVVKVNRPTSGLDPNVPFGGVKDSSTNTYREQGSTAVDFFSWVKSVYIGHD